MNLSLTSNKENGTGKEKVYNCLWCEKVFDRYQAPGGHQRAHPNEIRQQTHQYNLMLSQKSKHITKSNLENGPHAAKGKNNAPLRASIRSKRTMPSAQSVHHPIYTGSSANHIGHVVGASSGSNHQFNAHNLEFFSDTFSNDSNLPYSFMVSNPSFLTEFGLFDSQNPTRGEIQNKFSMVSPPQMPDIDLVSPLCYQRKMVQKKEMDIYTKDAHAVLSKDEANNASTSDSTNYVKGNHQVDLDLSLHL